MPKKRAKKKTARKMTKKKAVRKVAKKTAKKKRRKGTVNAYARRTKEEIKRDGKSLHTNGFDLTDQQMLFVDKYLCEPNLNATKAAIAAGYSKKSAHSQASTLMANSKVKKYLRKRMKNRRERIEVKQDKLVGAMAAIALCKPSEFVDVRDGTIIVKDLADVPLEIQGAVRSYEPVFSKYGRGIKVRFADSIAATKLLMQHLGMLGDAGRESNVGTLVKMFDEMHAKAEGEKK